VEVLLGLVVLVEVVVLAAELLPVVGAVYLGVHRAIRVRESVVITIWVEEGEQMLILRPPLLVLAAMV
jgi:hypothetical protein